MRPGAAQVRADRGGCPAGHGLHVRSRRHDRATRGTRACPAGRPTPFHDAAPPGARLLYATDHPGVVDVLARAARARSTSSCRARRRSPRPRSWRSTCSSPSDVLDRKWEAIQAHASQVEGLVHVFGERMREWMSLEMFRLARREGGVDGAVHADPRRDGHPRTVPAFATSEPIEQRRPTTRTRATSSSATRTRWRATATCGRPGGRGLRPGPRHLRLRPGACRVATEAIADGLRERFGLAFAASRTSR